MLLAEKNPNVPGEVSLFGKLVSAGEEKSLVTLPFQLHTFLVNCLVEHLRDHMITHQVLALGLLGSAIKPEKSSLALLKRTGDAALLLAGLFPERALRLRVSSTYFRLMGQSAYSSLADNFQATGRPVRGRYYNEVAEHFQLLEKVLSAARAQPETEWKRFRQFYVRLQ